tara:strand:- start:502 stop:903 length:402 start_codon:yes stop_codon:yes gene_type:complete
MEAQKKGQVISRIYIGFSILSLAYVSLLSLYSPQMTMDLVQTTLPNTDAMSSIRGIYGGVGMVIVATLVYLFMKDVRKGVQFLAVFWFAYLFSRLLTMWIDGPLGDFGKQWLVIESVMCLIAVTITYSLPKTE